MQNFGKCQRGSERKIRRKSWREKNRRGSPLSRVDIYRTLDPAADRPVRGWTEDAPDRPAGRPEPSRMVRPTTQAVTGCPFSAFSMRFNPSVMFGIEFAYENLRNPSPYFPNAVPERHATPAS